MKYILMLLISWFLSFSYDSAVRIKAHKRAESAAKAVGINPLWIYNKSTYVVQISTAEVQSVLERKDRLNTQLLELCNDLQRKVNDDLTVVECVGGQQ